MPKRIHTLIVATSIFALAGCELEGSKISKIMIAGANETITLEDLRDYDGSTRSIEASGSLCFGSQLNVFAEFTDGGVQNVTNSVAWSTSDENQITIGNCGTTADFDADNSTESTSLCKISTFNDNKGIATLAAGASAGSATATIKAVLIAGDNPIEADATVTLVDDNVSLEIYPNKIQITPDTPSQVLAINSVDNQGNIINVGTSNVEWALSNAVSSASPATSTLLDITNSTVSLNDTVTSADADENPTITGTLCIGEGPTPASVKTSVEREIVATAKTATSITATITPSSIPTASGATLETLRNYNSSPAISQSITNLAWETKDASDVATTEPSAVISLNNVNAQTNSDQTQRTGITKFNADLLVDNVDSDADTTLTANTQVEVTTATITDILFSPAEVDVLEGTTAALSVTAEFSDTSTLDASSPRILTSQTHVTTDSSTVFTVTSIGGSKITAGNIPDDVTVAEDTSATVTVTYNSLAVDPANTENALATSDLTVNVFRKEDFAVVASSLAIALVADGDSPQFSASLGVTNGTKTITLDVTHLVGWSTDNAKTLLFNVGTTTGTASRGFDTAATQVTAYLKEDAIRFEDDEGNLEFTSGDLQTATLTYTP